MKKIISLALLFLSLTAGAQVPGFMGNRFSVFVEANPTPALFVQNVNNEVVAELGDDARNAIVNRFAFNFRPQITVEYLVKRDLSLGLSYSRFAVGTVHGYQTSPDDYEFIQDNDVLRGQSIGVHAKFYNFRRSGTIAPIGFYQTLSVYLTQGNSYDDKKSTMKLFEDDFIYPVVTLGLGRQMMIVKNLMLKTGVELGWAVVPFNFLSESESDWTAQEYAGYNYHRSLFGAFSFNFNVAVGYTF